MKVSAISPSYNGYSRVSKNEKLNVPANKADSVSFKGAQINIDPNLWKRICNKFSNSKKYDKDKIELFKSAQYIYDTLSQKAHKLPDGMIVDIDIKKSPTFKEQYDVYCMAKYKDDVLYSKKPDLSVSNYYREAYFNDKDHLMTPPYLANKDYFRYLLEIVKKEQLIDEYPHIVKKLQSDEEELTKLAKKMRNWEEVDTCKPMGKIWSENTWKKDINSSLYGKPELFTLNSLCARIERPQPKEGYIPVLSEMEKLDDIIYSKIDKFFSYFLD